MAKKRGHHLRKVGGGASVGSARQASADTAATPRIPLWLPATLFVLLTAWLFRSFIFSDQMLFGGDTLSLGYVARAFYAQSLKHFSFPRWNPHILGGTPFLEALTGGDSLYPPSVILLFFLTPYRALGWKLVAHICVAGLFMFGWMRALKASRAAALLAGVGYMLSPFFVSWVYPGHDGKIFVTALAPLLFWATERLFVRPGAKSLAGVGFVVALVILTTHFEMAYFLFGGVGLYATFRAGQVWQGASVAQEGCPGSVTEPGQRATRAARDDTARDVGLRHSRPAPAAAAGRLVLFLAAALLGAGAAAVQFIPAVHYVTHYSRRTVTTQQTAGQSGRAWSSNFSMHPEEAMGELIPEFPGNNSEGAAWSNNTYWGRNGFRSNTTYAGIVLLLLAVVAFAGGARLGVRWFFAGVAAVAFLFSLGTTTPVWGIFYDVVPGIRMFRAPEQAMLLYAFAVPTLGGLGLDLTLQVAVKEDEGAWTRIMRILWIGSGVMVLLALLAGSGALTSFWTTAIYRDISDQQLHILRAAEPFIVRGAFIAVMLTGCTAALAWAVRHHYLSAPVLVAGLLVLVVVDEARIDGSFIQPYDFQTWATPDPNIKALLDREQHDPEPYRLLDLVGKAQDVKPAMFGIDLAAGHHPNDLVRYRDLIGMVGSEFPENLVRYDAIRRLLNVRYILWPNYQLGEPIYHNLPVISRTQVSGRIYETLLAEPGLARARLVARAVVKPDGQDMAYMTSPAFQPDSEVVLSEPPPTPLDGGPVTGTVTWEERSDNVLRLKVTSDRTALLVIADNWFPAWHATLDGQSVPILRAYHTLRAVPVPSGDHTVEMTYHSSVVATGLWVSAAALVVLLALAAWGIVHDRRARGRPT